MKSVVRCSGLLFGLAILTLTSPADVVFQAGEFERVSLASLPAWPQPTDRPARTGLGPEWTRDGGRMGPPLPWDKPERLPDSGLLVLVSTPPPEVASALAEPLRRFLARGGSLLCTYTATRAIAALGIDARPNDEESSTYSARDYSWGFTVSSAAARHPLFAGLVPVDATHPHSYFVAQTAASQTVTFNRYRDVRPTGGTVLATYSRREGREFMDYDQCTVIEWKVGNGRVVSVGIPLYPVGPADPAPEPNRRRFVANLLAYLNPQGKPVRLLAPGQPEKTPKLAACDELATATGGMLSLVVPEGARRFDGLPGVLANEGVGAEGFSARLSLAPGAYRMHVGYLETGAGSIVFMQVDGRDAGLFFVPQHETGTPYVTRKASTDFVIQKPGPHSIGLVVQEGAGVVVLDALSVETIPMPTPRDWSKDDAAARPAIDAWGWYAPISYQRPTEMGIDLAYMQRRVVEESYVRGSNMVEFFHDYFFPFSSWHIPWDDSDPKRPKSYRYVKNPNWGPEQFIQMARLCHEHDMLMHWYNFTGGTDTTPDKLALLEKAADDYGDALDMPMEDLMDGMGLESYVIPAETVGERILPYNPGYYLYDLNRSTTEALSFFTPSTMCAHAWEPEGYDDAYPIVYPSGDGQEYYWRRYPIPANGQQRLGYQADCRIRRPPSGPFKDTWFFGGGCYPDWVVKQANDFLRDTYLDPAKGMGSAIWWITEVEEITDDPMRRVVYAESMDPIRAALAIDLGTTGVGGFFDQTAAKHPAISPRRETIWRQRLDRPYTDHALQNNYFRLYIPADGSPEVLDFDPTGTAHFDSNSMALRVSEKLVAGKAASGTSEVGIVETGGVVASILSSRPSGRRMRYEMFADSPILKINDDSGPVRYEDWQLGLSAYERREARGDDQTTMALTDEDGVLPTLLVHVRDGRLREKNGTVVFEHFSARDMPLPIIMLGLLVPPYRTLDELEKALNPYAQIQPRNERDTTVLAGASVPQVVAAELTSQLDTPRWVQERGWWWYRGIQPSQVSKGKAFVKVYATPGDTAQVRPYGFLPEGVKFGWGSQYVLTFKDVKRADDNVTLTARVLRTTPWVFAPRLEFDKPIASVTLDGKPWCYFDGAYLMLPNVMGDYRVEVKLGTAQMPSIARTQGVPSGFTSGEGSLKFTMGPAGHIKSPAQDEVYYALVRHPGKSIASANGAKVERTGKDASILSGRPGEWTLTFKP